MAAPDANEAITFDRPIYFIDGDPGETVTVELIIKNSTHLAPTFSSQALDMQSGEGTGSRAFEYVPAGDAPRGAGAWIRPLQAKQFTIPAFQQEALDITIDIPREAGAGGHYAALMFSAPDPRPDAEVQFEINQPVAFFLTVNGAFQRDVRVTATPRDGWRWRGGRTEWDVVIRNEGDVHEPISGRLRIDGLFGGVSSKALDPGILFPGEMRRQRVRFDLRSAPDIVTGAAQVDLDEHPPEIDDSPRVIVVPIWLLVLVALAIVVIAVRLRMRGDRRTTHEDEFDDDADGWIEPPS